MLVEKSDTTKYRVRSSSSIGLIRMWEGGGNLNMFSILRMLLRTSHPIERPSSKLGRKAGIYHLPWIRIGLKKQSFLSDAGFPLYLMVMACRAQLLFCMDLPQFLGG